MIFVYIYRNNIGERIMFQTDTGRVMLPILLGGN